MNNNRDTVVGIRQKNLQYQLTSRIESLIDPKTDPKTESKIEIKASDIRNDNNPIIEKDNKTNNVCTNCGAKYHTYKSCTEPPTSWGIILITYGNMENPKHLENINLSETSLRETQSRVNIETNEDRYIVSMAYNNIKFLMISRKNSLGYVEFIRGRYRPEKIGQVIYLFKQMMQSEIDKIKESLKISDGFESLWKSFWGNKTESPYLLKEKSIAKANYNMLKFKGIEGPELDLNYIVETVKADYDTEEWGFPKGRKNKIETEEECAIREFKEESGYTDNDFTIIKNISPLVEELIGTNGIKYKHVYYIAELKTNKSPKNNITESQKEEIGNVQFMDFTQALECIRDYHIGKKILLERLFTYYLDRLIISNRKSLQKESIKDIIEEFKVNETEQVNETDKETIKI
jgi:8-oxo-dGTP pyrophosphatase MutT (NUDIX family)